MREARHHLLTAPGGDGEERARATIRRFLIQAGTPEAVVGRLEEALLDAAYSGRWESAAKPAGGTGPRLVLTRPR